MDASERKKVGVVSNYVVENFNSGDWLTLGQLTGQLSLIKEHPRLFRSMSFGDEDYDYCVAEVLDKIFTDSPEQIVDVIDQFDIDLWYEQKAPHKYERVFGRGIAEPEFWRPGYLRAFISHLVCSKEKITQLKGCLEEWGVTSFVAHQDIQPSKEWQSEIEAGLQSMDVMVAVVEPGFRDSEWTDQEVGYALGRNIEVLPLLVGKDPHGFIAKIQGIKSKGKVASELAREVIKVLLRKPKFRQKLISGISKALSAGSSDERVPKLLSVDEWGVLSDSQLKQLIEASALSDKDKVSLGVMIDRVGAFEARQETAFDDDIPF